MRNPFRRRVDPEIRATLIQHQRAEKEMVRVFVRGRKNMRAAVCFTGYPRVGRDAVALRGEDGITRAVVSLRKIIAVQRAFTFRQGRPGPRAHAGQSRLFTGPVDGHIEPIGYDPAARYRR